MRHRFCALCAIAMTIVFSTAASAQQPTDSPPPVDVAPPAQGDQSDPPPMGPGAHRAQNDNAPQQQPRRPRAERGQNDNAPQQQPRRPRAERGQDDNAPQQQPRRPRAERGQDDNAPQARARRPRNHADAPAGQGPRHRASRPGRGHWRQPAGQRGGQGPMMRQHQRMRRPMMQRHMWQRGGMNHRMPMLNRTQQPNRRHAQPQHGRPGFHAGIGGATGPRGGGAMFGPRHEQRRWGPMQDTRGADGGQPGAQRSVRGPRGGMPAGPPPMDDAQRGAGPH